MNCGHPSKVPTAGNPTGDCGQPAVGFIHLGQTGNRLPVCAGHRDRYLDVRPLSEWVER